MAAHGGPQLALADLRPSRRRALAREATARVCVRLWRSQCCITTKDAFRHPLLVVAAVPGDQLPQLVHRQGRLLKRGTWEAHEVGGRAGRE